MFTQGEWSIEGYHTIVKKWGKAVAYLNTLPDTREQQANAHLIAAAPDMYKALKELVDHFRMNDLSYYESGLCTDAILALRKARGEV